MKTLVTPTRCIVGGNGKIAAVWYNYFPDFSMRSADVQHGGMFSDVSLEDRVPQAHPLRRVRGRVEGILASLHKEIEVRYSHTGRPSAAPEKSLRALLLQIR